MSRVVLTVAALVVAAAGAVLGLPPSQLAPGGVVGPPSWVIATSVAALALVVVGVALAASVGFGAPALLGLVIASTLLAATVSTSSAVPAAVSVLATGLAMVVVPATAHLTLAWPGLRPTTRPGRIVVALAWAVVGGGAVLLVVVWDPFTDVACRLACGDNPLAIWSSASASRILVDATLVANVAAGLTTAALATRRDRFWPGGIAAGLLAADALARLLLAPPLSDDQALWAYGVRLGAYAFVGAGLCWAGGSRVVRSERLRRIAGSLDAAPAPGAFASSLSVALGDPHVNVAYAVDGSDRYVHADGGFYSGPRADQVATRLVRDGEPVALIAHRAQDTGTISDGLGAAARLAVDNERLEAELRARLADLRESRERIVERSDAERLRLERDLHDGIQQRLLVLGYELRAAIDADPDVAPRLSSIVADVDAALDELRAIAHGIYPGVLESHGLGSALDALLDRGVPMDLDTHLPARAPQPVERAAYLVVLTAVRSRQRDAAPHGDALHAQVWLSDDRLLVTLTPGDDVSQSELERLGDRVGALGGYVTVDDSSLRCVLPCG